MTQLLKIGLQHRDELTQRYPFFVAEWDQLVGTLQAAFNARVDGEKMGLLLGLAFREQHEQIIVDELDQLVATIQTAFNSLNAKPFIKSLQTGTIDMLNSVDGTKTILAVDRSNSVLCWLGQLGGSPDVDMSTHAVRIELTNATTVTAKRTTSNGYAMSPSFAVVEFQPGILKSVTRGTIGPGNGTATITAVDTTRSVVTSLGLVTTDTTDLGADVLYAQLVLTNSRTVTATQHSTVTVGYQVIEFK